MSIALALLDKYSDLLTPLKSQMLSSARPLYELVDLPSTGAEWVRNRASTKDELLITTAKLESANLVLRAKLQKMTALTLENIRLRELLNATSLVEENVLVAEVISASSDPNQHVVVVNKGSKQGVFVGQAVVDAEGLFGQVMQVGESVARVLQISDRRHSIPIEVERNGLRFIAEGENDFGLVKLQHIASTTDLKQSDVLLTSGLGQLFPRGYPVAQVVSIEHQPGKPFSIVYAKPFARLNQSRHVLLLFSTEREAITARLESVEADGSPELSGEQGAGQAAEPEQ